MPALALSVPRYRRVADLSDTLADEADASLEITADERAQVLYSAGKDTSQTRADPADTAGKYQHLSM